MTGLRKNKKTHRYRQQSGDDHREKEEGEVEEGKGE